VTRGRACAIGHSPQAGAAFNSETDKWEKVIKDAGLKAE
jgi:hypothetical protein